VSILEKKSNFIGFSEKLHFKFISDPELPGSGIIFSGSVFPRERPVIIFSWTIPVTSVVDPDL
jgi:hypothetical protein